VEERILGRTGRAVSVVGLGTWQLGADWGEVDEADALAVLDAAAQAGVTFFDSADVYGDGRSERLIGRFLAATPGLPMMVATKMGRRVPQDPARYTLAGSGQWRQMTASQAACRRGRAPGSVSPAGCGHAASNSVRVTGRSLRLARPCKIAGMAVTVPGCPRWRLTIDPRRTEPSTLATTASGPGSV